MQILSLIERVVRSRPGVPLVMLLAILAALGAGCSREEVTVQQVPKERAAPSPVASAAPGDPHAGMGSPHGAAPPSLGWTLPEGWQEEPGSGMRLARFKVSGEGNTGIEGAVLALPTVPAGHEADVVNILRERFQLAPLSAEALAAVSEPVAIGSSEGKLFSPPGSDAGGGGPVQMLVAVMSLGPASYYFTLSGPVAALGGQKPAFLQLLRSVRPEASEGKGMAAASGAPAGAGAQPVAGQEEGGNRPQWTVPGGWKELPPTSMVLARFGLGEGGQGEVTVSTFPGSVGGLSANVNRWRGQIGLAPLAGDEAERQLVPLDGGDGKAMLVDMTGTRNNRPVRMLGVIVPRGEATWFYKLVGDDAVAAREKENFLKFVKSVQYAP